MPSEPQRAPSAAQPEIEQSLQTLTRLLDDAFRIPGTSVRFGLDALVGLIPGAGDAITSIASFALLLAAVRHKVPKIVIVRMALNLAIDYAVGVIPFVGDAFDFVWKANRKNLTLLQKHKGTAQKTYADYAFVFAILFGLMLILFASLALSAWLISTLLQAVFR